MRNRSSLFNHSSQELRHKSRNAGEGTMKSEATLRRQRNILLVLLVLLIVLFIFINKFDGIPSSNLRASSGCLISFGSFRGHQYTTEKGGTIGRPKCLIESKWLKVSQHSVQFPGSDKIFDDWLWIDYHDRINVLVEDERKPGHERQFLVFQQTKYALEGRDSLAIIGGIIEPGEDPEAAARREVDEEMNGLQCNDFHFLGRYRTDVNRGIGWVNGFLASNCSRESTALKHEALPDEVGAADTERQDLKRMTLKQIRNAAQAGEFLEVQWTATVALALLYLDKS